MIFVAWFLVAATVIFILWVFAGVGRCYQAAVVSVAQFFAQCLGYTGWQLSAADFSRTYLGNLNLVPFLALAVVTPIRLSKRGKMFLIGLPILFFIHVINLVAHFPFWFHSSKAAKLMIDYTIGICGMGVPFAVWYVFARELPWLKLRLEKKPKRKQGRPKTKRKG